MGKPWVIYCGSDVLGIAAVVGRPDRGGHSSSHVSHYQFPLENRSFHSFHPASLSQRSAGPARCPQMAPLHDFTPEAPLPDSWPASGSSSREQPSLLPRLQQGRSQGKGKPPPELLESQGAGCGKYPEPQLGSASRAGSFSGLLRDEGPAVDTVQI